MCSGGFYPYKTLEKHWGYWCRYIYINRYMDAPKPVYQNLYELVKEKDYFVLTTNVDHCFQKAGFAKNRIFYTQGDYGLFQCSEPCHKETYDNEEIIKKMVLSQGFQMKDGELQKPEDGEIKLTVPTGLIPYCPRCGKPMSMNLRSDQTFVEDERWHWAAERYEKFIQDHKKQKIVFLELGVGYNTPGIIKYPFWQMTNTFQHAFYVCLNQGEAYAPEEIRKKSVCMNEDIGEILKELTPVRHTKPMLSADKTKSVDEMLRFANGRPVVLSWKLDGLTMDFHGSVDITDPCYNRDVWCHMTDVKIRKGVYTCIAWHHKDKGTFDNGEPYCYDVIGSIGIYLDGVIPCQKEMKKIGDIGVDAGLAGFFHNKPDYTDDEWAAFCDRVRHGDAWLIKEGFYSSSGYGDGCYGVYAYKQGGEITAIEIRFL